MNIAILGCGNMGGALARGLSASGAHRITVTSHSGVKAHHLAAENTYITAAGSNREAASEAELVIIAVKPWVVGEVLDEVEDLLPGKAVVSVAAGVRDGRIQVYAMPNIAAGQGQGVTFLEQTEHAHALETAVEAFRSVGKTMVVSPKQMEAGMMLSGCGIAYVMRMVRAMMQAGVEMGFRPGEAREIAIQTLMGAASVLEDTGLHPEAAIDTVTTPGGYTIKGLNALDHAGFTSAVIRAMKAGLT